MSTGTIVSRREPRTDSVWITKLFGNNERLRIFCFPYAGGGTHFFRSWQSGLPSSVGLYAIQLPGRGRRLGEAPLYRLEPMVVAIADSVARFADVPFMFFGHSMGALMAFETVRALRRHSQFEPAWLYASGCRAPHLPRSDAPIHRLSDTDLVSRLRKLDGTPAEILESPEILDLMLPALRADFEVIETYGYRHEAPLNCPISVFGGTHDSHVTHNEITAWCRLTAGDFDLHILAGNHFFLHESQDELLNRIAPGVARVMQCPVGRVAVGD